MFAPASAGLGFLAAIVIAVLMLAPASACGPDTDCQIGARHYRIQMPEGHDGTTPVGAILYAHGYRGSAVGVMRNMAFRKAVSEMGLALIAPKSAREDWSLPGVPMNTASDKAVELDYFDALLADVITRFAVDPARIMATGFSAGGMMVWTLACDRPGAFMGFAPIAGTFWTPIPKTCAAPAANILHIHGDADPVVPLAGRPIGRARQGNVEEALEMYTAFGGFGARAPMAQTEAMPDDLTCAASKNAEGRALGFCQFPGGHNFRIAHVRFAWEYLSALQ